MLGRMVVEPEHLLLALTRHGNVQSLLAERGVLGPGSEHLLVAAFPGGTSIRSGERIDLGVDVARMHSFDRRTGLPLR